MKKSKIIKIKKNKYKIKLKNLKNFKKKIYISKPMNIKEISLILKIKKLLIINTIKLLNLNLKNPIENNDIINICEYLNIIVYKEKNKNYSERNLKIKKNFNYKNRSIVATIMGEVNYGKTSIIKSIVKDKIIKEKNNITQNIEIYKIKKKNTNIMLIDTPGHEDLNIFKKKGIKITDVIILVLTLENELTNQDINIIKYAVKNKIPIILNINKLDKVLNLRGELFKKKLETFITKKLYIINKSSAKTKKGIKNLINKIVKINKNLKPKINLKKNFRGIIIENKIDKNLGIITTILVKSGEIKISDKVISGISYCTVKLIYNYNNKPIKNNKKNIIIKITGFNDIFKIGNDIIRLPNENIIKDFILFRNYKISFLKKDKEKLIIKKIYKSFQKFENNITINIIIKSNSYDTLKAIEKTITKLNSKNLKINIINMSTGDLIISDIELAYATKSNIIYFNLKINENLIKLSNNYKINMYCFEVIYDITKYIKLINSKLLNINSKDILIGKAKIIKLFKLSENKTIAGCIVIEGTLFLSSKIIIKRKNIEIFRGIISSLKNERENAKEIKLNSECGVYIKNFNKYIINDIIEIF